ncbi:MAG: SDR family NAD-dependent epimerase/dehydratase, partial [candidate division NC10 bacterium]|nr:SDR family NAD-dependent epimerase/dehydratase [candidate division NC10 bacterium]
LPLDDPRVRQPDIGLARARLGWEPTVDIAQGLALTIDYFRKQLAKPR